MVDSPAMVSQVAAVTLLALNFRFICTSGILIINEIFGGVSEMATPDVSEWFGSNPCGKCLGYIVNKLLKKPLQFAIVVVEVLLSQLQKERKSLLKEVPRLVWRGPGHHMVIKLCDRQGDTRRLGCIWPHRFVFRHLARFVFQLDDDSQRTHLASVIGQIIDHLLTQADLSRLPCSMLEMIALQTIALKRMKSVSSASPAAREVGMEISRITAEWKGKLRMTNSMKNSAILADRIYYLKG